MSKQPFTGQRLLVVGLAREGVVAARWLAERGAHVIVSDVRTPEQLHESLLALGDLTVETRFGPQTSDLLEGIHALIVSPGVPQDIPLLIAARQQGIPLSSETRLFAQQCQAPLVGITGSSGKTTTTTLTAQMIEAAGYTTWLGGNIGAPLLGHLTDIHNEDRVVMELSSFQLLYWPAQHEEVKSTARKGTMPWQDNQGISPKIAAILNITPNHLDRHPSMSHYAAAKANILAYQSSDDIAVLSHDDPITAEWANTRRVHIDAGSGQNKVDFPLNGQLFTFGLSDRPHGEGAWIDNDQLWLKRRGEISPIVPVSEIHLRGEHNLLNVLAATCLATAAGAQPDHLAGTIRHFTAVEHRLEVVRSWREVLWINDSIATSPERAIAALRSFEEPLILLAGGRDKHLPWDTWASTVQKRVRHVVAFGEMAGLIETVLASPGQQGLFSGVSTTDTLENAVELAAHVAQPGDVVLLAPGGTSYDAYTDFAARGQHFRDLVNNLT